MFMFVLICECTVYHIVSYLYVYGAVDVYKRFYVYDMLVYCVHVSLFPRCYSLVIYRYIGL